MGAMFGTDETFEALANGRRRRLLVDLLYHDPQPVPELDTECQELLDAHWANHLAKEIVAPPRN